MAVRQKRTPNFYLGVLFLYDFFEFFVNKLGYSIYLLA